MQKLVDKYADKLVHAGLAEPGAPVVGGLDAELVWNRNAPECPELALLFEHLNINSLLYAEPAEPYRSIINFLATQDNHVQPNDSETRTFMHDLPVIDAFNAADMAEALKERKSVIVRGRGIVTWGTVSPEQAFVFFSSACFACFVKFFSDYLYAVKRGTATPEQTRLFETVAPHIDRLPAKPPPLMRAPFVTAADVYSAVIEAGRATVEYRLVDSFFGNVSCLHDRTLYLSQTGSSLDELEGCIDPCVLDGSSCAGITASSELTAHREIVLRTDRHAVLHGHPKFSVIMSLYCDKYECDRRDRCHTRCAEHRTIEDVPIVPGEVGTGPHGLCHTLPPAMEGSRGVIVYGHGLFTTGQDDFNEAFNSLLSIERMCQERYVELVQG